jgi:pimeloyl-ACP methyl ester carboxylesterase
MLISGEGIMSGFHYGPDNPEETYVPHAYPENTIDLGEVVMNYVAVGNPTRPALLLVPAQTESWWGYEKALPLLEQHFQCFAVDLRGQGRSTRTPGRYTLNNMGNDLVRFLALAVKRPAIVSGLSSGGLLAAWLATYGVPGSIRGALCEDPPFFAAEVNPACGDSIRQCAGPFFALLAQFLGDQWNRGDWAGLQVAARQLSSGTLAAAMAGRLILQSDQPSQNIKEYDPEWARAFYTGTVTASCDQAQMLAAVKVPVLYTHHLRSTDPHSGCLIGAASDRQAAYACELIRSAGQRVDYRSFPTIGHYLHVQDPQLFVQTLVEWASTLK